MKNKFNRIERIAGLFILLTVGGTLVSAFVIMVQKGVFQPKITFITHLKSSNNIRSGTPVQMAGMKIGQVREVELEPDGKIRVDFYVFRRYQTRIKTDSEVTLARPNVIGEKVMDISSGSKESTILPPGSDIITQEGADIMDYISGGKISVLIGQLESLTHVMTDILKQAAHKQNIQALMNNLRIASDQMSKILPELVGNMPKLTKDLTQVMNNMSALTTEFSKLAPAMSKSMETLPETTKKLNNLLGESVILIKAMQKNFFLRGNVEDVREEEKKKQESEKTGQP